MSLESPFAAAQPRQHPAAVTVSAIQSAAARLRQAPVLATARIAASVIRLLQQWRRRDYPLRRNIISRICESESGKFSADLLDESFDALFAHLDENAVESFAQRAVNPRRRTFGFIMPGNVPGAGIHELLQVLITGSGAIVKTGSAEPYFFDSLQRSLSEIDPQLAANLFVVSWSREQDHLTKALAENADLLLAYGDDNTVASIRSRTGSRMVGYGSKFSAAVVARDAIQQSTLADTADAIAKDVCLFEQRGCLSVHHVMVEAGDDAEAGVAAAALCAALKRWAERFPPALPDLPTGMAVRHARETARWRRLGGENVRLWEGDRLAWTVIFDPACAPLPSPLGRTVTVSAFKSIKDLMAQIDTAGGKIESLSLADPRDRLRIPEEFERRGISRVCRPGESQSAPLDWRHGGIDLLT